MGFSLNNFMFLFTLLLKRDQIRRWNISNWLTTWKHLRLRKFQVEIKIFHRNWMWPETGFCIDKYPSCSVLVGLAQNGKIATLQRCCCQSLCVRTRASSVWRAYDSGKRVNAWMPHTWIFIRSTNIPLYIYLYKTQTLNVTIFFRKDQLDKHGWFLKCCYGNSCRVSC